MKSENNKSENGHHRFLFASLSLDGKLSPQLTEKHNNYEHQFILPMTWYAGIPCKNGCPWSKFTFPKGSGIGGKPGGICGSAGRRGGWFTGGGCWGGCRFCAAAAAA